MINSKNAKLYCCEPIENIEGYAEAIADQTQMWDCHHRLEFQGEVTNSKELLKKCKMYYARPAAELIFLTSSEHIRLHAKADRRWKIMNAKTTWEQRSKAGKIGIRNQPREAKARGGKKTLGKLWWTNGTIETRAFECPGEGWSRGRLK